MVKSQISNELEMITLIQKGDVSAKKHLYLHYSRYLTGVCARYVIESDHIMEILQESFLKIFSSINSFKYRGEGSLKGWLSKIVVNESLKYLKSNYKFDTQPLSPENEQIAEEEPDLEGIPLSELHRFIRELPVGYRTILNLYVFEEKSHKEIAKELNIKENSSASQFHRAKNLLASKIKKYHQNNISIAYER